MNVELNIKSSPEKVITNESAQEILPIKVINEEDKQAKIELKAQKEIENNEQIKKTRENLLSKFEGGEIKEGVSFVFEQYPELANIGTLEQYSNYLETIFPDSKVKNIVYHGTREKFDSFDKSKIGLNYGKLSLGFNFMFGLDLSYNYGGNIKPVLVNAKNPIYVENINGYTTTDSLDTKAHEYQQLLLDKSLNFDSILGINTNAKEESVIVIQEPEQIHILGSKQDFEKFKEFVSKAKSE